MSDANVKNTRVNRDKRMQFAGNSIAFEGRNNTACCVYTCQAIAYSKKYVSVRMYMCIYADEELFRKRDGNIARLRGQMIFSLLFFSFLSFPKAGKTRVSPFARDLFGCRGE